MGQLAFLSAWVALFTVMTTAGLLFSYLRFMRWSDADAHTGAERGAGIPFTALRST